MEFFDEITKVKKDFPKVRTVTDEVKNQELNFYQIFANLSQLIQCLNHFLYSFQFLHIF